MKSHVRVGIILITLDISLLFYWLFSGIYISVIHAKDPHNSYILDHILASLHFPATIALCIMLESYRSAKHEMHILKERCVEFNTPLRVVKFGKEDTHSQHECVKIEYMLSWIIALVVSLGTDTYSLISYIYSGEEKHATSLRIELSITIWALIDVVFIIFWVVKMYFVITSLYVKMEKKRQQEEGGKHTQ